jgi:putative LysE/RhtB family amino acid efflux pump
LILGFIAIFSSMGAILNLDSAPWRPAMVLMGVALGGALWWLLLSKFMSQMKTRISPALLEKINRWTGVFVAAFGFVLLLQIF